MWSVCPSRCSKFRALFDQLASITVHPIINTCLHVAGVELQNAVRFNADALHVTVFRGECAHEQCARTLIAHIPSTREFVCYDKAHIACSTH